MLTLHIWYKNHRLVWNFCFQSFLWPYRICFKIIWRGHFHRWNWLCRAKNLQDDIHPFSLLNFLWKVCNTSRHAVIHRLPKSAKWRSISLCKLMHWHELQQSNICAVLGSSALSLIVHDVFLQNYQSTGICLIEVILSKMPQYDIVNSPNTAYIKECLHT